MTGQQHDRIWTVVQELDGWFDTMRTSWPVAGYGGPVVHWWSHQLTYQGAGLDWRYEGIVAGYLNLWRRTGQRYWLDKATRAGEDLVAGQLPDGHFQNSRFELNPGLGGTPHEAAADVALLMLAEALAPYDSTSSTRYRLAAESNLDAYWFGQLWYTETATLWDHPEVDSFVPNKAATFLDAVMWLAELSVDATLIERYAVPTGLRILEMQVREPGDMLNGAIAQNRFGWSVVQAYFPLYVARCVPPLLSLADLTGDMRIRDGALAAARFLDRVRGADGSFPQVLYPKGRCNRRPKWIAGAGDMVRAFDAANRHGARIDIGPAVAWILGGVREGGKIATAHGFGSIVPVLSRRDRGLDEVGVAGWCDKAFRALTTHVEPFDDSQLEVAAASIPSGQEVSR